MPADYGVQIKPPPVLVWFMGGDNSRVLTWVAALNKNFNEHFSKDSQLIGIDFARGTADLLTLQ